MKWRLLLAAILLVAIVGTSAQQHSRRPHRRGHRRSHHIQHSTTTESSHLDDVTNGLEEQEQEEQPRHDVSPPQLQLAENEIDGSENKYVDPCGTVHCGAGRECEVDEGGNPHCSCVKFCPIENDMRRKVCSNKNETWDSDCELYRMRCQCDYDNSECTTPEYKHIHIDYYGECREMPKCTEDEMADFPRRMRDWLFNIMRDLADRNELSTYYMKMERDAEKNLAHKWSNAAVWKWCDLDGKPHDRIVSRHELFPIRAPLLALEHCIGPFLDACDVNNDHYITLKEWGTCLELKEDELEMQCEDLRNADIEQF